MTLSIEKEQTDAVVLAIIIVLVASYCITDVKYRIIINMRVDRGETPENWLRKFHSADKSWKTRSCSYVSSEYTYMYISLSR